MKLLNDRGAFAEAVYEIVRQIPEGCVATYGQVARLAGYPGAARAVGNALHVNPDPVNTNSFRIVTAQGKLAANFGFGGPKRQRELLEDDGIEVINYRVDLEEYQWKVQR